MPLPTPNTGESRSEFMARFVLPIWKDGEKVWAQ